MTVAVIEPANVLALSVPPLPENALLVLAPTPSLPKSPRACRPLKGRAVTPALMELPRLTVEVDFWLAATFSTI